MSSAPPFVRTILRLLLALSLAFSMCIPFPVGKAHAAESDSPAAENGVGGDDASSVESDVAQQSDDSANSIIPQASSSSDPIVDWTTCGTARWMIDAKGCLTIAPLEGQESGELADWGETPPWYDTYRRLIASVETVGAVTSLTTRGMFNDCSSLASLDLSSFDTSSATDMRGMFHGCSSLASLDLSSFDTSSATDMRGMFHGCSSLASLDLSSFDTSKVRYMGECYMGDYGSNDWYDEGMFAGCESLASLDLSSFDTSNVTDMSFMFDNCESLASLDLSSFDTSKVAGMRGMFFECESLASLDLSSFDTSSVTDMRSMFTLCQSLASLDLSSFDTSRVRYMGHKEPGTNIGGMFALCGSLASLDLSSFDTSNVTDMSCMFYDCSSLASLDLSSFDTSKVGYGKKVNMFVDCTWLRTIKVGEDFSFENCYKPRTPSKSFGYTGLWVSSADGKAYEPDAIPNYTAATYTAQRNPGADRIDISSAYVYKIPDQTYTGSAIEPAVRVTLNDHRLTAGYDYEVVYADNTQAGTATVVINGIQVFTGQITCTFQILPKNPEIPDPVAHTITYVLNGGVNAAGNPATFTEGSEIALAAPTKSGYEFAGWYADAAFTTKVESIPTDARADITLYAKWIEKEAPNPSPEPTFPDVDYSSWYGDAVTFVASKGLITGYSDSGLFGVGDALTRAQLATILYRNANPGALPDFKPGNATGMPDVESHVWYTAGVNWAVKNGVINGYADDEGNRIAFGPDDPVTFEQLVTVLANLSAGEGDLPDESGAMEALRPFRDHWTVSAWARPSMAWAAERGLVSGYDEPAGKYLRPGENVARERVAVVLMRAFDLGILE